MSELLSRPLARVLSRLERYSRLPCGDYMGRCPAHDDAVLSLSLRWANGRVLLKCHAGCPTHAVVKALGLTWFDLWDSDHKDQSPVASVPSPARVLEERDILLRDRVYRMLLDSLDLSRKHYTDLQNRGLDPVWIDRAGYRTLRFLGCVKAARLALSTFGERAYDVPGLVYSMGRPAFTASDGLLIPVRNPAGQIVGILVRADAGLHKYRWLSTARASVGMPVHVPLGTVEALAQEGKLRLTEGPLKADVAFRLSGVPTLGVGGIAAWKRSLPLLELLKPECVLLAVDADWQTKANVAQSLRDWADTLHSLGYPISLEHWPLALGKGIDDALLAGVEPKLLPYED